jgi:hypothetical protein
MSQVVSYPYWEQDQYGQPVDYSGLHDKAPSHGLHVPQLMANGYDMYQQQYHHPLHSQPLTPVLSSNSSNGMHGATSPALSTASSLPHSPLPQQNPNYGQLGMLQPGNVQYASYDAYASYQQMEQAQQEMGALQEAQQATLQMMNGFGMMPMMQNAGMQQNGVPMNQPTNRTVYVGASRCARPDCHPHGNARQPAG